VAKLIEFPADYFETLGPRIDTWLWLIWSESSLLPLQAIGVVDRIHFFVRVGDVQSLFVGFHGPYLLALSATVPKICRVRNCAPRLWYKVSLSPRKEQPCLFGFPA
jgi:hypothetical protein